MAVPRVLVSCAFVSIATLMACAMPLTPTAPTQSSMISETSGPNQKAARTTARLAPSEGRAQERIKTGTSSLEAYRQGNTSDLPATGPLKDVHYDFDRSDLDEDARMTLKDNALWLRQHPTSKVQIEGHADERGTSEYNLALGAKRAQAAKDYLVTLGIASSRLSTVSYGEELPLCQRHDERCWQRNRRAHFVVGDRPSM